MHVTGGNLGEAERWKEHREDICNDSEGFEREYQDQEPHRENRQTAGRKSAGLDGAAAKLFDGNPSKAWQGTNDWGHH